MNDIGCAGTVKHTANLASAIVDEPVSRFFTETVILANRMNRDETYTAVVDTGAVTVSEPICMGRGTTAREHHGI